MTKQNLQTALIKCKNKISFLILEAPPKEGPMNSYIQILKAKKVSILVRACTQTYATKPFEDANIRLKELAFEDGKGPPPQKVTDWNTFISEIPKGNTLPITIGVHCVAGLGRAPLLVAIAMLETGTPAQDVIDQIRKVRAGAFNQVQLDYIYRYKRSSKNCAGNMCTIS